MTKKINIPFLVFFLLFLPVVLMTTSVRADNPDILIADFESEDYGNWNVEGEAFGPGPAVGTFQGQMDVSGYEGNRLVNTFFNGDTSTGKLTSPEFKIERKYITFLIGGGGFQDETCMKLFVDGKEVRQATGTNTSSGGSEKLDWRSWDVSEFLGQKGHIAIIDDATGGWGHINVDQIAMSDTQRGDLIVMLPTTTLMRQVKVEKGFAHLPVKTGNPTKWMQVWVDGKLVREFTIELAEPEETHFHVTLDLTEWLGKTVTLVAEKVSENSKTLSSLVFSDQMADQDTVYTEKLRPVSHFSVQRGWINDPNGLLYYDGKYHMFGQHNPYGVNWGNMSWFYATSEDLIHWTEYPDAIHPDELGTMFSGSGVVDHANTSGFQVGDEKPLVLIYTAAGGTNRLSKAQPCTQGIAYSTDAGKTWQKYDGNPILEHIEGSNRDPKVFWHTPSGQWVMALYLDREDYALFGSPDLKNWTKLCDIRNLGCSECPDMFELPVDGEPDHKKWVFWGGNGMYLIGTFDGKTFTPESEPLRSKFGQHDYAAQTWSDIPEADGRRIQIAWMTPWGGGPFFPDMPFNCQFTVPRELTLRTTKDGIRLFTYPVGEVEKLRKNQVSLLETGASGADNQNHTAYLAGADLDAYEIELVLDPQDAKTIKIGVPRLTLAYDVAEKKLNDAPLDLVDGKLKLQIFLDRSSFELFANDGIVQMAYCLEPEETDENKSLPTKLFIETEGGKCLVDSIKAWELKSIWEK